MFGSVLIANRGEIAVRIITTARRLGLRCIAVYAPTDRHARHVGMADEAFEINPIDGLDAYLCVENIMKVAQDSGADSVHPGYGFLSERAELAAACEAAGLVFIGPKAQTLTLMADKAAAKAFAAKSGLPVPHSEILPKEQSLEGELIDMALPVLIKPLAGGGGKGMIRVDQAGEAAAAVAAARRIALSAFGDDRVMAEQVIAPARHVEVQIFADAHGQVAHLFERDCSVQRRHQKLIEEAPAPNLSDALRHKLYEAATRLAVAADYLGAGTVEFLVEAARPGILPEETPFYFLEMNTRLQVEHPVSEMITGLDFVEWQFRVASGEPLPASWQDMTPRGHAVEVRIYAEDPENDFLPSPRRVETLRLPGAPLRVDTSLREGDRVPVQYDPMIAKLVAHGKTRGAALAELRQGLGMSVILGPKSNIFLLHQLLDAPEFRNGLADTDWLDSKGEMVAAQEQEKAALICAAAWTLIAGPVQDASDPWQANDGFQLGGERRSHYSLTVDGAALELRVEQQGGARVFHCGGQTVSAAEIERWAAAPRIILPDRVYLWGRLRQIEVARRIWTPSPQAGAASGEIYSPMPGRLAALLTAPGDRVAQGQQLAIIEAMKMEHVICAPFAGIVSAVTVAEGAQLGSHTPFIVLDPEN